MMTKTLPLQTLSTLPMDRMFSMGECVTYHHRAGVARYKKVHKDLPDVGWKITQGALSGEKDVLDPHDEMVPKINVYFWNHRRYSFFNYPQRRFGYHGLINKTVMVWPEDGAGWVVGLIRKAIGVSQRTTRSSYHNEIDQGYFAVEMYVDLYVVKTQYQGTDTILCPIWAVKRRDED